MGAGARLYDGVAASGNRVGPDSGMAVTGDGAGGQSSAGGMGGGQAIAVDVDEQSTSHDEVLGAPRIGWRRRRGISDIAWENN